MSGSGSPPLIFYYTVKAIPTQPQNQGSGSVIDNLVFLLKIFAFIFVYL
jgi:hypothetical protein